MPVTVEMIIAAESMSLKLGLRFDLKEINFFLKGIWS